LLKNLPNCFTLKNGTRPINSTQEETDKIVEAYVTMLDTYLDHYQNKIMIFDRFLFSEWVYSIKRGHSSYRDEGLQHIHKKLRKIKDVLLIYCRTDKESIKQKFLEDKEEHTKVEEIETLFDRYDHFMEIAGLRILPYDYKVTTPEKVARFIKLKILGNENDKL